jgi:hypothetical protein
MGREAAADFGWIGFAAGGLFILLGFKPDYTAIDREAAALVEGKN